MAVMEKKFACFAFEATMRTVLMVMRAYYNRLVKDTASRSTTF